MTEQKTKQEAVDTIWKGEIKDSKGRVLTLRNPSLWDEYLLGKIMGKDAEVSQCMWMGQMLIKVAAIDGRVMATPTSYNEFSANLSILAHEGLNALMQHVETHLAESAGEKEEIKK